MANAFTQKAVFVAKSAVVDQTVKPFTATKAILAVCAWGMTRVFSSVLLCYQMDHVT